MLPTLIGKLKTTLSSILLPFKSIDSIDKEIISLPDCVGSEVETRDIILFKNLRFYREEECKDVNEVGNKIKEGQNKVNHFTERKVADFYINVAFGTAHSSVTGEGLLAFK